MRLFISIRVINAETIEEAVKRTEENYFEENHFLCDRVIPLTPTVLKTLEKKLWR